MYAFGNSERKKTTYQLICNPCDTPLPANGSLSNGP